MGQFAARLRTLAAVTTAGLLVAACSGYDVELKGGVFDALGVNDINASRKEPKMANRQGLVVPPSTASLPKPGAPPQTVIASNGEPFPVNPEDAKKQRRDDVIRKHNAFCEKAQQRYDSGIAATVEQSPWGACHQSALRKLTGRDLSGKKAVGAQ
ncbi:MAG: hypothetical protein JXQ99_17325 [Hyphomicrobiaceae bacterium]